MLAPRPARTLLNVHRLEDRDVPSTGALNLTAPGSSGAINGALFQQFDGGPTGPGDLTSIVRLREDRGPISQGYNTDARPLQFNEASNPDATRSVRVTDLPLVTIGGTAYREVVLDVNEPRHSPRIALDELRVYVGGTGDLRGYNARTEKLAGMTAVYDLDAGRNRWVTVDARSGGAAADMLVYIPASSLGTDGFVYLYSKFGTHTGAGGGAETWSYRTPVNPPTATASLSGTVYDLPLDGTSYPVNGGTLYLTTDGTIATAVATVGVGSDGTFTFSNVSLGGPSATFVLVYVAPPGYTVPVSISPEYATVTLNDGDNLTGLELFLTSVE